MTTIRLAELGDLPQLGVTSTRAFVGDPVMRWFFPDDDEYEAINPQLAAHIARRWQAHGTLWCTDDGVAMAGWVPPGRPEVDVGPGPEIQHPGWRLARFAAIGEALKANMPTERHWYLNMLATHPDWQRRGLGSALLEVVFARARRDGVPCYLETETEANVAYYHHHGFEIRSEWDLPDGGPHMWGMLRP